jgi:hypothetical protein
LVSSQLFSDLQKPSEQGQVRGFWEGHSVGNSDVGFPHSCSERKHGFSAEPVPVSAYAGSSKNLKDPKDPPGAEAIGARAGEWLLGRSLSGELRFSGELRYLAVTPPVAESILTAVSPAAETIGARAGERVPRVVPSHHLDRHCPGACTPPNEDSRCTSN